MRATAVFAVLVLASCGRGQWRAVDERLDRVSAPARAVGYAPLAGRNNEFGTFADSTGIRWVLALDSGRAYALAAACVDSCRGVDLEITLPDGTGLVRDSSARADATLAFVARRTGDHAVRLGIAGCQGGPCRWAAQLYARGR